MPHPRGPAGTITACHVFDIEIKRHMERNNKFGWLVHLGPLWPRRTYYDKIEPYDTIVYDIESKAVWTRRDQLPVLDRIPLREDGTKKMDGDSVKDNEVKDKEGGNGWQNWD